MAVSQNVEEPQNHGASIAIWVCLKMLCTPKPNGFHDHYPVFKWLFHWAYTQHFQTNPFFTWLLFRWMIWGQTGAMVPRHRGPEKTACSAGSPLFFSNHWEQMWHFLTHFLRGLFFGPLWSSSYPIPSMTPWLQNYTYQMLVAYSDAWLLLIARPRPSLKHSQTCLVVSTPLKNISQWEGLSHILWKIKNV